jgi:hypothetical protein
VVTKVVLTYLAVEFIITYLIYAKLFGELTKRKREDVDDSEVWGIMIFGFWLGLIWPVTLFTIVFGYGPFTVSARMLERKRKHDQEKEEREKARQGG